MDITQTTAPKSDQQNFDDYAGGITRTVTITEVKAGSSEQPVEVHLAEFPGRPYKPSKSMRRVMVAAWGPEASNYVGRRLTLYGDPEVKFGGIKLGGIKIAAMSHIDKALSLLLTASKGKRAPHKVEPLTEDAAPPSEPPPASEPLMSDGQRKILHKLVNQLGLTREQKIAGSVAVIQRPIESTSEMTQTEARRVIERLEIKVAETAAEGDPS